MLSFGKFQTSSSFKLYAKSQKMPFDTANAITKQIEKYENDLKYASDDEKDLIYIYDYIDEEYHNIYKGCEKYLGIISSKSKHPCFSPDTKIMTNDGYKKICDVKIGDLVLTHKNRFKKVNHVMSKKSETIYNVNITGEIIRATGNHPFYTISHKRVNNNGKRETISSNPYWKEVKDLEKGDSIGLAINEKNIIPIHETLPTDSNNFWWFVGRYIGDGYCVCAKRKTRKSCDYRIHLSCHIDEVAEIEDIIKGMFHYNITDDKTSSKAKDIYIYNKKLYDFLQQFGKYAHGKHLNNTVFDLPSDLLKSFIDGYISADGSPNNNALTFTTVSKELAYDLQYCIHKAYKSPCTLTINKPSKGIINGKSFTRRPSYTGRFNPIKSSKDRNIFKYGCVWIRYKNKEIKEYNDTVYNLEVDEDNSYTANNFIVHNCGYLLYDGNIKEELGLIRIKNDNSKKECIATVIDGEIAENYKFLKNDLLKVDVVYLIAKVYEKATKAHSVNELMEIIKEDKKTWDIYKKGLVIGVNQVEKEATKKKVMKYKPTNISELTAFIAAIRPSFRSMYGTFEKREPFDYGIESFDNLIQTEEMPYSYVLYQEQIMATLAHAGFAPDETYGIIKAIAKKKPDIVKPLEDRFIRGFSEKIIKDEGISIEDATEITKGIWRIIDDSSAYSFNASHAFSYALDSVYCAYLKANYPFDFYEVLLEHFTGKGNKDKVSKLKQEMEVGFGIKVGDLKLGKDNRGFVSDKKDNSINESMLSIKFMNKKCADFLYKLGKSYKDKDFIDILKILDNEKGINCRQISILMKLNYFSEFANNQKLLDFYEWFDLFGNAIQIKKEKYLHDEEIYDILERNSDSTNKMFKNLDNKAILKEIWKKIDDKTMNLSKQAKEELEYLGYLKFKVPHARDSLYIVSEQIFKYKNKSKPFIKAYRIKDGKTFDMRIKDEKLFSERKFGMFDILDIKQISNENKVRKIKGRFANIDEKELVIKNYIKIG